MLGISIYLKEDEKENYRRIKEASEHGFTKIFTSLHIPEDNNKDKQGELFKSLCDYGKKYNMEVYGDFGPDSLKRMNLSFDNIEDIKDFGLSGIRVDYGYSNEEMVKLSNTIKIFLNASTVTEGQLNCLKDLGADFKNIEAWHNFYPRPETGLDKEYFIEKNKLFKRYGMKVAAYVEGDEIKRGPLFLGLPTLEKHRYRSPYHCAVELIYCCYVDTVYIGDIEAKSRTLKNIGALKDNIITLRYKSNVKNSLYDEILSKAYTNRLDEARDVVRADESRIYASCNKLNVKKENTLYRNKGTITIDNEGYKRYMGELQIAKKNLDSCDNVNVIGEIIDEDKELVDYIKGGVKFRFLEV